MNARTGSPRLPSRQRRRKENLAENLALCRICDILFLFSSFIPPINPAAARLAPGDGASKLWTIRNHLKICMIVYDLYAAKPARTGAGRQLRKTLTDVSLGRRRLEIGQALRS